MKLLTIDQFLYSRTSINCFEKLEHYRLIIRAASNEPNEKVRTNASNEKVGTASNAHTEKVRAASNVTINTEQTDPTNPMKLPLSSKSTISWFSPLRAASNEHNQKVHTASNDPTKKSAQLQMQQRTPHKQSPPSQSSCHLQNQRTKSVKNLCCRPGKNLSEKLKIVIQMTLVCISRTWKNSKTSKSTT